MIVWWAKWWRPHLRSSFFTPYPSLPPFYFPDIFSVGELGTKQNQYVLYKLPCNYSVDRRPLDNIILSWGRILALDNLIKRGFALVSRYCIFRFSRETVIHLLLHYYVANALWSDVFTMSEIQFGWRNWFGRHLL